MRVQLIFAVLFVVAQSASVDEKWQGFKIEYGKTYKSLLEEKQRFAIFQERLREFEEHNARFAKGEVLYQMGINQFTDWTEEEVKAYLTPITPETGRRFTGTFNDTTLKVVPEPIDWRLKGVVTSVKDQGKCGGCYAFSAIGALEGQVAIATGHLVSLSVQNVIDCSRNWKCTGGHATTAFDYIKETGVDTEADYPYTGKEDKCHAKGGLKISNYAVLPPSEYYLMEALKTIGPIAVEMEAFLLYKYSSGIYGGPECINANDHAVLVVGAGTENGTPYWIIKNSWGAQWGENGYFRMLMGHKACGITMAMTYPIL